MPSGLVLHERPCLAVSSWQIWQHLWTVVLGKKVGVVCTNAVCYRAAIGGCIIASSLLFWLGFLRCVFCGGSLGVLW